MGRLAILSVAVLALFAGCQSYKWTSGVPKEMRTVAVPTFANGSSLTELGPIVSREILREFQREGTFRIASHEDAAVEIQGEIVSAGGRRDGIGDRSTSMRLAEHVLTAVVKVTVVDRRVGKVLVDGRIYTPTVTFVAGDDLMTGERDASGRLAEDLARQVVDDVLGCPW